MNQSEFNILVINTTAVADEIFSINCGEFVSAASDDPDNDFSTEKFDLDKHFDKADFQTLMDNGYASLGEEEVKDALEEAWLTIEVDALTDLHKNLPGKLPDLIKKITGEQLTLWIKYALEADDDNYLEHPFYAVRECIMTAIQGEFDLDDDVHDKIREAIAYDNLQLLLDEGEAIQAADIQLDDLVSAALVEAHDIFKWLLERAKLDDARLVELLGGCVSDQYNFNSVYNMLSFNDIQLAVITKLIKDSKDETLINCLSQVNQD